MTTFDNREQAFENKFAHDNEVEFNIIARRNKLLGLWAAAKMNLDEENAKNYAAGIVEKTTQKDSAICVLKQIEEDFSTADVQIPKTDIEAEMNKLLDEARKQIING
jgi:hypothetical protein